MNGVVQPRWKILRLQANVVRQALVDVRSFSLGRYAPDLRWHRVDERLKLPLTISQRRFGTLTFCQIENVGDTLPGVVLEASGPDQDRHPAAILAEILLLASLHLARGRELGSLLAGMHLLPLRRRHREPIEAGFQVLAIVLDDTEKRVIGV